MLFPYRIFAPGQGEQPRCSLRTMAQGYGFCHAARSCAECPLAKLDERSQYRIEPGDVVHTISTGSCTFKRFDERNGFSTGFVWLQTTQGLVRAPFSAVQLLLAKAAPAAAAMVN